MSLRPGLQLLRNCARPSRGFHYLARQPGSPVTRMAMPTMRPMAAPRVATMASRAGGARAAVALGLGLAGLTLASSTAKLDGPAPAGAVDPNVIVVEHSRPEPPQSMVSVPQLTFGAACGICAGVFVKKGFKLVAFFLGGVFVLLQYLSSKSFVSVDWKAVSKSYDGAIGVVDEQGRITYPTPQGVLNGFIDFLTANFQQRATFVAGFILGLRLG